MRVSKMVKNGLSPLSAFGSSVKACVVNSHLRVTESKKRNYDIIDQFRNSHALLNIVLKMTASVNGKQTTSTWDILGYSRIF